MSKVAYILRGTPNYSIAKASVMDIKPPDEWGLLQALPQTLLFWRGFTIDWGGPWRTVCDTPFSGNALTTSSEEIEAFTKLPDFLRSKVSLHHEEVVPWLKSRPSVCQEIIERNALRLQAAWRGNRGRLSFYLKKMAKMEADAFAAKLAAEMAEAERIAAAKQWKIDVDAGWIRVRGI